MVERDLDGHVRAELRGEFALRAGHGMERIYLAEEFRPRIATGQGDWTQRSMPAPPADTDRGLWLAVDHLLGGGLVRDFTAAHLARPAAAPGCASNRQAPHAGTSPSQGLVTSGRRSRTSPRSGRRPAAPTATD
ncbi:hypothetical protein AB0465_37660 [Streptomyces griseoviridis]|uniref:hypothetical protein n=1 Tax=Streptomyces griseoviridis TaxID=45398 RepID=UPI0033EF6DB9